MSLCLFLSFAVTVAVIVSVSLCIALTKTPYTRAQTMTETVQGVRVGDDADFTDISLESYHKLRKESSSKVRFQDHQFASPYVPSEQEWKDAERLAEQKEHQDP